MAVPTFAELHMVGIGTLFCLRRYRVLTDVSASLETRQEVLAE
jgi:hypothetical protein